ncbi:MAG: hypothetical protein LDL41_09330 [Coleofasciculus sp. S288]|nr:hypothetical protein [Coleofasciculus sp. S288]
MRLTVKPENPLEAIALQTRKELHPFLSFLTTYSILAIAANSPHRSVYFL